MDILLQCKPDRRERWQAALQAAIPDCAVRVWPDVGDPAGIELIVTSSRLPIDLSSLPNLRFVATTGAGVEHLIGSVDGIPPEVPIVRVVDPKLTSSMAEYVLTAVLRYHREFHLFEAAQKAGKWLTPVRCDPEARTIGIMGLGALGQASARLLTTLGFRVLGWSRRLKDIDGIECHHGADGLRAMLAKTEILVCLLPLTAETEGILDAAAFALLPTGATLINVGRGKHIVEMDLLAALDAGPLAHATLDVFTEEPLPREHAFWAHPNITVTPHIASMTVPESAVEGIAHALRLARRGEPLPLTVDRSLGY